MPKFILAPTAKTDLKEIWQYLSKHNQTAADKLIRAFAPKFQMLASNKELGTRQDQFVVEMRMFPFKDYQIYYFPTEEGVDIYRVLHSSRDIKREFEIIFNNLEEE